MNINVDTNQNQREKDKGQEGNVLVTLVIHNACFTDTAELDINYSDQDNFYKKKYFSFHFGI